MKEGLILRKLEGQIVSAGPLKPMGFCDEVGQSRKLNHVQTAQGSELSSANSQLSVLQRLVARRDFHEVTKSRPAAPS